MNYVSRDRVLSIFLRHPVSDTRGHISTFDNCRPPVWVLLVLQGQPASDRVTSAWDHLDLPGKERRLIYRDEREGGISANRMTSSHSAFKCQMLRCDPG